MFQHGSRIDRERREVVAASQCSKWREALRACANRRTRICTMGQTLRLLVGERGLYETRTQARGEAWLVVSPTGALQILALALTLLAALSALQLRLGSRCRRDVPLVGARSVFEFRLILDWRFLVNAKGVLDEGWSRVCFSWTHQRTPATNRRISTRTGRSGSLATTRTSQWSPQNMPTRSVLCLQRSPTWRRPRSTTCSAISTASTSSCTATSSSV